MTIEIIYLLIIFQLKHFIADYPLQGKYMLGKFNSDWSFLKPLAAHCGVQSLFTLLIASFWTNDIRLGLALALFDFVIHFFMDRIKAGPKYLGRFDDKMKPFFWWALGLDQMVHHITHYAIIYMIITSEPMAPISISMNLTGLPIICALFTLVTAVFSVLAYSKVVGLENATHQVAWMDVETPVKEPEFDREGNEVQSESQLFKDMASKMYPDVDEEQV